MLERSNFARREGPLAAAAASGPDDRAVVRTLPGGARFALRVRDPEGLGAFGLGLTINALWSEGERFSARLGPDEWLLGAPEADLEAIEGDVADALQGRFYSLVDVSHRNVALEIAGPDAAAALNAGCPLDLSDAAFPAGSATRTLLGKAEIVLMRPTSQPLYRVECWRSFAAYVHGFLIEAGRTA